MTTAILLHPPRIPITLAPLHLAVTVTGVVQITIAPGLMEWTRGRGGLHHLLSSCLSPHTQVKRLGDPNVSVLS